MTVQQIAVQIVVGSKSLTESRRKAWSASRLGGQGPVWKVLRKQEVEVRPHNSDLLHLYD
jgi:hypothetical protein